jgi:phage terminase large subunit-like protein
VTVVAPPTLGNVAADWIEDMLGVELDDEEVRFLQHAYEVAGDGSRIWRRAFLSRMKGFGKTCFAASVAAFEFAGPCRYGGRDAAGEPVGVPAVSPAVYFAATEEMQAQIGYDDALRMLTEGPGADQLELDPGQTRTHLLGPGGGVLRYLSAGASSKEGYRPSFIATDETLLFLAPPLKRFFITLLGGLPKRPDAWMMETSTSPAAGSESVAAETLAGVAQAIEEGRTPPVFLDHRAASEHWDLDDPAERERALLEAAGTGAARVDIAYMVRAFDDPQLPEAEWRRRYLNQQTSPQDAWLDGGIWERCARPDRKLERNDRVALGFDGSASRDASALCACRLADGHLELLHLDEPSGDRRAEPGAQVDREAVDAAVHRAMNDHRVERMYADPFHWTSYLDQWTREFRRARVREWRTNRQAQMVAAVNRFETAVLAEEISHNGDPRLARHVANARRRERRGGHTIEKETADTPRRIDAAVAAILAFEAAADAGGPSRGGQGYGFHTW